MLRDANHIESFRNLAAYDVESFSCSNGSKNSNLYLQKFLFM